MTLSEFLCHNTVDVPASPLAFSAGKSALETRMIGAKRRDLNSDYAIHEMNTDPGDVVLLYQGGSRRLLLGRGPGNR
jgi:hypothetical protein